MEKNSESRDKVENASKSDAIQMSVAEAYCKIAKYVKGEQTRTLNLQTYIGETVMYELLTQSYGAPEYTIEEKYKRLISCVIKAIENHQKAAEKYAHFDPMSLDTMWPESDDPHSISNPDPDISSIRVREIPVKMPAVSGVEEQIEEVKKKKRKKF